VYTVEIGPVGVKGVRQPNQLPPGKQSKLTALQRPLIAVPIASRIEGLAAWARARVIQITYRVNHTPHGLRCPTRKESTMSKDHITMEVRCIELDDEDLSVISAGKFNSFLKIDGIKGESTDSVHQDWVETLSYNH
jgi:hypothetical protein